MEILGKLWMKWEMGIVGSMAIIRGWKACPAKLFESSRAVGEKICLVRLNFFLPPNSEKLIIFELWFHACETLQPQYYDIILSFVLTMVPSMTCLVERALTIALCVVLFV